MHQKHMTKSNPLPADVEAYRILGTYLQCNYRQMKVIAFMCPSVCGEISSHICNTALSMAKMDNRILLIDADIRNPSVHKYFGLKNDKGISQIVTGQGCLEIIYTIPGLPNLHIIPSGTMPEGMQYSLSNISGLLYMIKQEYDFILINSPPAGDNADGIALSFISDGTILLVNSGRTTVAQAQKTKEMLDSLDVKILGIVLDKRETSYISVNSAFMKFKHELDKSRFRNAGMKQSIKGITVSKFEIKGGRPVFKKEII